MEPGIHTTQAITFFGKASPQLILLGIAIVAVFIYLITRNSNSLFYNKFGTVYLGFLGVGVITVMDVLTSVFYAPAEAYRYLQTNALFFISFTAVLVALYCFSMTEIAEIMESHMTIGGGVYNFVYIVFGRTMSLIAASSILVDYVNTAAISSISAIENLSAFSIHLSVGWKIILELAIIWIIVLINIVGIKENVKTTFTLFAFVCFVLGVAITLGIANMDANSLNVIKTSLTGSVNNIRSLDLLRAFELIVVGVGSTILAYSGIESVLQTHRVVEDWRVIRKTYIFLIIFIGTVTPLISFLALSQVANPMEHTHDLVTYFSKQLGGYFLGFFIVIAAVATLAFAVNTAMVAGVELTTSLAGRYGIRFLLSTNRFGAHQTIILFMGCFFSFIILITQGNQNFVADMYAIGLVATFVLNLGALVAYRFVQGFEHAHEYKTSIAKNAFLFILFTASFVFIFIHKKYGAMLWVVSSIIMIAAGYLATKYFRDPEMEAEKKFDQIKDIEDYLEKLDTDTINLCFVQNPTSCDKDESDRVFITFGLQRVIAPSKACENHFILSMDYLWGVSDKIEALLVRLQDRFADKKISVHFGWPTGSWFRQLYTGFAVRKMLKIPEHFPEIDFYITSKATGKTKSAENMETNGKD